MKYLSNKDKKNLLTILNPEYSLDKKDEIKINSENLILKNNLPYLIKIEESLFIPHLKTKEISLFPSVFIDHGAVPFLLKGADMMRPGIQKIEGEFNENEIVIIREEVKGLALGVGISLLNNSEMNTQKTGKSVKVLHHMKDKFY